MKDPIYKEQSDQVDIINTEQDSPIILDILNKVDKKNDEIVTRDINTRRRVRARRRLISKSSSECSIDQEAFSFSIDGKTRISDSAARTAKSKVSNNIGHIPHKLYNIQITLPYTYPHLTRDTSTYLYLHRQHFSLSLILTNCFIFMCDILYSQFHN